VVKYLPRWLHPSILKPKKEGRKEKRIRETALHSYLSNNPEQPGVKEGGGEIRK